MSTIEISRDDWLAEMEEKAPSRQAFDLYVDLEQFVVSKTRLKATYRRNMEGKSHHAAFCGSAAGHCSLIQIHGGSCYLNWEWITPIPGCSEEKHLQIRAALDGMRRELGGKKGKGWEQVTVGKIGLDKVKQSLLTTSEVILRAFE